MHIYPPLSALLEDPLETRDTAIMLSFLSHGSLLHMLTCKFCLPCLGPCLIWEGALAHLLTEMQHAGCFRCSTD